MNSSVRVVVDLPEVPSLLFRQLLLLNSRGVKVFRDQGAMRTGAQLTFWSMSTGSAGGTQRSGNLHTAFNSVRTSSDTLYMSKFERIPVSTGIEWIGVPEAGLFLLCGCPADAAKHLIKLGLVKTIEKKGVRCETGPNAILLSDVPIQNGQFANLSEFPVLQMLYRQGMLIPGHPNNTGEKPMLVGNRTQVTTQLNYIYRGNYGLATKEEILSSGVDEAFADEVMRIKLKFAFGRIQSTQEFLHTVIVDEKPTEIKNGVMIRNIGLNHYELTYQDETIEVDLNIKPNEYYRPVYNLGNYLINREYFSVIHSGEGDGWDIHRPCMSSILMFDGEVYLIDAGPNLLESINSLGISISSIRGIFHTHCHDDHFAGLTTLIQSDHKIKYYTTSLVRKSVSMKLSALLGLEEDVLSRFFNIVDLEFDKWNEVGNLMVKPLFSPHPVETANFIFQAISENGFKTYYHMADIASVRILKGMVTNDSRAPGMSQEMFERVRNNYLIPCDLKKIDSGGGMIHGDAVDFAKDKSKKIVISHTSLDLTDSEKEIGSRVPFGLEDVLIKANVDPVYRYAEKHLTAFFNMPAQDLRDILNCPVVSFSAGSIIYKAGIIPETIYLTLTGSVEMVRAVKGVRQLLAAGSLVGGMSVITNEPLKGTYVALGHLLALEIPTNMYLFFIHKHKLLNQVVKITVNRYFLSTIWLFSEMAYSPVINTISLAMVRRSFKAGSDVVSTEDSQLLVIIKGEAELRFSDGRIEQLHRGGFCGEETIIESACALGRLSMSQDGIVGFIPGSHLKDIPAVLWKLMEMYEIRRKKNMI